MLADAPFTAFSATTDAEAARAFYGDVLGLPLLSDGPFAMVFAVNGAQLRVAKVREAVVPPYSVLDWRVSDIVATVEALEARGIAFVRYPQLPQDERGIWSTPDGAKVAWFHDPEGHVLSVSQAP